MTFTDNNNNESYPIFYKSTYLIHIKLIFVLKLRNNIMSVNEIFMVKGFFQGTFCHFVEQFLL